MRNIIIHASATEEFKDFSVVDVDRWHRTNGWNGCGYHFIVRLDGRIEEGRPFNEIGAHTKGHNKDVGICYIGGLREGVPCDTRTEEQKASLLKLIRDLRKRGVDGVVYGHRDFAKKACPCFDAKEEYKNE